MSIKKKIAEVRGLFYNGGDDTRWSARDVRDGYENILKELAGILSEISDEFLSHAPCNPKTCVECRIKQELNKKAIATIRAIREKGK